MNAPQPAGTLVPVDQATSPRLSAMVAPRFDFSPQTFDQAMRLSEMLAASEMVPKQYRGKPGDCFIAMQWGAELGLKALQALQSIAVVNGKPSIYGDAGKAILLAAGCIIEEDDIPVVRANGRARCRITRHGRPPVERTYSIDDAKQAGLLNKDGPWKTNTQRQMAWRAFWFAARDGAADLLRGIGGAEEAADIPPEQFMGAAEEVPRAPPPPPAGPQTWPADKFAEQLVRWTKAVEAGLKTPAEIVALARSKGALTPEQEKQINALQPAAAKQADTGAAAAPPPPGADDPPWQDDAPQGGV